MWLWAIRGVKCQASCQTQTSKKMRWELYKAGEKGAELFVERRDTHVITNLPKFGSECGNISGCNLDCGSETNVVTFPSPTRADTKMRRVPRVPPE